MVFSTILFLCAFLPITIIGYYLMPGRLKNYFLLAVSLFFYAWGEPEFVWIMMASILVNYGFGMWIAHVPATGPKAGFRKLAVILGIVVNVGILFVFKYLTFTMSTLQRFISDFPVVTIALPIGISFYTFQGLSYVIDVYRDERDVQKNPFKLALYISMFPQLIAGPIVRYKDVKESLSFRIHSSEKFASGVSRFIIGLSKKAILANMTGSLADNIMTGDFSVMSASVAWLGAIAYTLQIYFDFSGYSDMAIGLGRIFGFEFLENFNYPYISRSVSEFWRRWHMSLSGWFRDYLYIPLGGNRRGNVYRNLFVVFLVTGIWHGADWGFLLWGIWHGIFILLERFLKKRRETAAKEQDNKLSSNSVGGAGRLKVVLGWLYTMLVVMLGWVLFGIVDVKDTLAYVKVMFGAGAGSFTAYGLRYYLSNQMIFYLLVAILACIPWKEVFRKTIPSLYSLVAAEPEENNVAFLFTVLKKIVLLGLLILCFVFIINSSYNPFIYFRF